MDNHSHIKRYFRYFAFMVSDYIAAELAFLLALELTEHVSGRGLRYDFNDPYIYIWVPLIFVMVGVANKLYHMRPIVDTVRKSFYCVGTGVLFSLVLLYFKHHQAVVSGWFPLFFVLSSYSIRSISDYALRKFLKLRHLMYIKVVVIGAGLTAEKASRFYESDTGYRYDVVGIIDDNPKSNQLVQRYPLLGGMDRAGEIVKKLGVHTALIIAPGMNKEKLIQVIGEVQPYVKNVHFVPDLLGVPTYNVEPVILFSEEMLVLKMKNQLARRRNRVVKRVFDIIMTVTGGIIISPILLLITAMVAWSNHGGIIYAHKRIGKDGKEFPCYKFQTMVSNGDEMLKRYLAENPAAKKEWEANFKLENDPRVTRLGRILRKTSLDELPQLLNVLKGEMSLVGPRPIIQAEVHNYGKNYAEYSMVLPGITGMWQVNGRSDTTYDERVAMDTWYVRNWSVWMDIVFLFKTVKAVACGKGAY